MSTKYIIDTSAWLAYVKGAKGGEKVSSILEEGTSATSIVAIAEIADKFEREGRPMAQLLIFIKSKSNILPMDISIALHGAKLKQELRKKSKKASLSDGVQLATALQNDAILVTTDNDFRGMPNTMVI